jgi:hypothetical protein
MVRIDDDTGVPIKWAFMFIAAGFALLSAFVGIAFWASETRAQGVANARDIDRLETVVSSIADTTSSIDRRLSRMEGAAGLPHNIKTPPVTRLNSDED